MEQFKKQSHSSGSKTGPLLIIAFLGILYSACNPNLTESTTAKPESLGDFGDVVVLADESYIKTLQNATELVLEIGEKGFPPPAENIYDLKFSSPKLFDGFYEKHFNQVVLLNPKNAAALLRVFPEKYQKGLMQKVAKAQQTEYFIAKNIWASPQRTLILTAPHPDSILPFIQRNQSNLIANFRVMEGETGREKLNIDKPNKSDSTYRMLKKREGYTLTKPASYRLAHVNKHFYWFRKQRKKTDYGLFAFSYPLSQFSYDSAGILAARDSFTSVNIPGQIEGSHMIVSPNITPILKEVKLNGINAIEIRGWWEVKNDFMGGPFVLYAFKHPKQNRIVCIEGNIYSPGTEKMVHLRETETILSSFQFE